MFFGVLYRTRESGQKVMHRRRLSPQTCFERLCEVCNVNDNKATGWKIPLLFCGVVLGSVCIVSLSRGGTATPPAVPASLLHRAEAIAIDLDADAEGKAWKARIASAAGGFSAAQTKDANLEKLILTALEARRFDASCTAAVLIRDDSLRDALFDRILETSAAECASLPWGVLAAHGMRDPNAQTAAHARLPRAGATCHEGKE